jgi:glutaredoxin
MDPSADATRIVLYGTPGCHLCQETRDVLERLIAERRATGRPGPTLVEVDIHGDVALLRAFMETIPVVEIGGDRLELATSPGRVRAFLASALDGVVTGAR